MQVPRHWRMKQQLYRLNGVRYSDGNTDLLNRPGVTSEAKVADSDSISAAKSSKTPVVRVA